MSEINPYESPSSDAAKSPPMAQPLQPHHERLVCVAKHQTPAQAHLLRSELESNGIEASVHNEESSATIAASIFGRTTAVSIDVFVMESNFEKALKIKHEMMNRAPSDEIPEWTCRCGEKVDAGFEICWSCLKPYETQE